jgi:hypothetical protein
MNKLIAALAVCISTSAVAQSLPDANLPPEKLRQCVVDAAVSLAGNQEKADTIVRAAFGKCEGEWTNARTMIEGYNVAIKYGAPRTPLFDVDAILAAWREKVTDAAVLAVLEARK